MSRFRPGRRTMFATAVALTIVASLLTLAPARAVQDTVTSRLQGNDRYETAAAVALDGFPDGADNVILATGVEFADALAANGLAGALDAPLLLTGPNQLPATSSAALDTLAPTTVYLMGGTAAISDAVSAGLAEDGYSVVRIEGESRHGTAAAAADEIAETDEGVGSTGNGVTAIVANARSFPDAVSIGGVAFAGHIPVLLTETNTLHPETAAALQRLGVEHVIVVGGSAVVSDVVIGELTALGFSTQRLHGSNRYGTNTAIARYAQDEFSFTGPTAVLATGEAFPDALAGGTFSGKNRSVLLLTVPTLLPGRIEAFLSEFASPYDALIALGGPQAISDATLADAATAAKLDSLQSYDVSPSESVALPPSSGGVVSDGAGERTYTAAALDPSTEYSIALLDAEVVDVDDSKIDSFSVSDDADAGIDGGGPEATADSTADGTLEFTIDATDFDSVIPVVYLDADGDGSLDIAAGTPLEPFGLGGRTTWVPEEAADGDYDGDPTNPFDDPDEVTVTGVDRGANFFVTSEGTFYYSTGDLFALDIHIDEPYPVHDRTGVISFNQFEGLISVGDVLQPEYFQDGQSQFTVVDDEQSDLTGVIAASAAVTSGGDRVTVSWDPTDQPDAVYQVVRDNDRDGEFEDTDSVRVQQTTNNTVTFTETAGGTSQYIVRPFGGTSGQEDNRDDPVVPVGTEPGWFASNEIRLGLGFIGLTNGSAAVNVGLSAANEGDTWYLHFSKTVQVASNASITVAGNTYTNGTNRSSWQASGSTIAITLGSGSNSVAFSYPGTITGLTGVSDAGGTSITAAGLRDTQLENNGPELMLESSTCNVGDAVCTLAFNEPVSAEAEETGNYDYTSDPSGNSLDAVTLGDDERTITLEFTSNGGFSDGELNAGDTISPFVTDIPTDVSVDGSRQPAFDFVLDS